MSHFSQIVRVIERNSIKVPVKFAQATKILNEGMYSEMANYKGQADLFDRDV